MFFWKLPKCLQIHILTKYISFSDLQAFTVATHICVPEKYILTTEYLVEKRKFSKNDAAIIKHLLDTTQFSKSRVENFIQGCDNIDKVNAFLVLREISLLTGFFKEKLVEMSGGYEKLHWPDIISKIVDKNISCVFTDSEEEIIKKIYERKLEGISIIFHILAIRGFVTALEMLAQYYGIYERKLMGYILISGNMEVYKYFLKKGYDLPEADSLYYVKKKFVLKFLKYSYLYCKKGNILDYI
jgi:hypothetical protein